MKSWSHLRHSFLFAQLVRMVGETSTARPSWAPHNGGGMMPDAAKSWIPSCCQALVYAQKPPQLLNFRLQGQETSQSLWPQGSTIRAHSCAEPQQAMEPGHPHVAFRRLSSQVRYPRCTILSMLVLCSFSNTEDLTAIQYHRYHYPSMLSSLGRAEKFLHNLPSATVGSLPKFSGAFSVRKLPDTPPSRAPIGPIVASHTSPTPRRHGSVTSSASQSPYCTWR